jgi:hypothetical protein
MAYPPLQSKLNRAIYYLFIRQRYKHNGTPMERAINMMTQTMMMMALVPNYLVVIN